MEIISESSLVTCQFSILFGGLSPEHPASIASFEHVVASFREKQVDNKILSLYYFSKENKVVYSRYSAAKTVEEFITSGEVLDLSSALTQMAKEDAYHINLLHGNLGEDGHIQGVACYFDLKGSFGSVLPASLAMSKYHMAHYVNSTLPSIQIPETLFIHDNNVCSAFHTIKKTFTDGEVVIKPNSLGASLFTEKYHIRDVTELSITSQMEKIFEYDRYALVQRFIAGKEYSVGCLHLPEQNIALDVVEITTASGFFGHEEKHRKDKAKEVVLTQDTSLTLKLKKIALDLFESTGFEYMCRFDFIVTHEGDIYFLEANPIPGLMKNSIFPKMLTARNLSIPELFTLFNKTFTTRARKKLTFDYVIE